MLYVCNFLTRKHSNRMRTAYHMTYPMMHVMLPTPPPPPPNKKQNDRQTAVKTLLCGLRVVTT